MNGTLSLATVRDLFEYNDWARDRVLDACAALTDDEFQKEIVSSFPSVRATLIHLMVVEWVWLERFHGRSPSAPPVIADFEGFDAIVGRWRAIGAQVRSFVESLDEAAVARVVTYQNLKGEAASFPLSTLIMHLINHQSYHRGQLVTMLRQLNAQAPHVDLLVWELARKRAQ